MCSPEPDIGDIVFSVVHFNICSNSTKKSTGLVFVFGLLRCRSMDLLSMS